MHRGAEFLSVEFRRTSLGFRQRIGQGLRVDAPKQEAGMLRDVLLSHAPIRVEDSVAAVRAAAAPEPRAMAASVAV